MSHQQWSGVDCWRSAGDSVRCVARPPNRADPPQPNLLSRTRFCERSFESSFTSLPPRNSSPPLSPPPPNLSRLRVLLAGPKTSGPHLPTSTSRFRSDHDLTYPIHLALPFNVITYICLQTLAPLGQLIYWLASTFPPFPLVLETELTHLWRMSRIS